jgi:hypothetical protein
MNTLLSRMRARLYALAALVDPPSPGASLYYGTNSGGTKGFHALGGGGGGTTDHAALTSNLAWTLSAHTGTASRLASFDGAGAAAYTQIGAAGGVQAWDADLDGYAALASAGLVARTGAGTAAARTLTAGSGQVIVSNGDGVAGNPTVDLAYAGALRETSGPSTLPLGSVLDGQVLRRSGSSVVGVYLAVAITVSGTNADAYSEAVVIPSDAVVTSIAGSPV